MLYLSTLLLKIGKMAGEQKGSGVMDWIKERGTQFKK
jgi:hypothetical protein